MTYPPKNELVVPEVREGKTERILRPNIGRPHYNCRCVVIRQEKEVKGERIDEAQKKIEDRESGHPLVE
jgi:hypothetical protein